MSDTTDAPVTSDDRDEILATARDYIESWLDGDADRMARCLHPELAKRSVEPDPETGSLVVRNVTRDRMVELTGLGHGTALARPYEVSLLDAYGNIATVRLFSSGYMDYLHLGRSADGWQIVNVAYQDRPG